MDKAWREAERARLIAGHVALPVGRRRTARERVRADHGPMSRRPLAVGIGYGFQRMPTIHP